MSGKRIRQGAALILAGSLVVGAVMTVAGAESSVDRAFRARRDLGDRIDRLHEKRRDRRIAIHRRIKGAQHQLRTTARDRGGDQRRFRRFRQEQQRLVRSLRRDERALVVATRTRVATIRARRGQLADWIDVYGVLRRCPVAGPHTILDNFGVTVSLPDVPTHTHMGNDISAATGTPIVAPFDGEVVAVPNELGGMAVKVYGADGYVYNAHLSTYGTLGRVSAGTVIGYVGSTGDATGPHDHFEWHPGDGPAVDPNPFLLAACG